MSDNLYDGSRLRVVDILDSDSGDYPGFEIDTACAVLDWPAWFKKASRK